MAAGLTLNPPKRKTPAVPSASAKRAKPAASGGKPAAGPHQRQVYLSWKSAGTKESSGTGQREPLKIGLDPKRAPEVLAAVLQLLQETADIEERRRFLPASEVCDKEDAALFNAVGKRATGRGKR